MDTQLILLVLNVLIVILFTIAYVPQLITTYKAKKHTGVSSFFWLLISISTILTLRNVLATGNAEWYVYMGQIINASIATFIFVWLIEAYPKNKYYSIIVFLIYGISLLTILYFLEHDGIQAMATVAIILAYVDQIIHFIKTKSAEGTTPYLYLIFAIGLSLLVCIFAMTGVSVYVILTECVNITLLLVCTFLSVKYKN